ncbi:hypothetical protein G6F57_014286 [Rhizopus arrhizus]|nr:hypothetical protein G6F57_014286 [Rhizopus arrhizus]
MPRAHAADTPATGPTPPSIDSCDLSERRSALVGVDLGRHGGTKKIPGRPASTGDLDRHVATPWRVSSTVAHCSARGDRLWR